MADVGKAFKLVLGLLITVIGVQGCIYFWPYLWDLMKAAIGPFVILVGLLILAISALD